MMLEAPVPIFPLPNVVLFPQAVLPLHIFEPRYRSMIAEALAGNQLIAVALLRPGFEADYLGKADIEPVVCVGEIVAHQKLDDGRFHLLLGGLTRARVIREVAEMPFRSAVLEPIADLPTDGGVTARERAALSSLFEAGPLSASETGRRFVELLATSTPVGTALDLLAFHFVNDSVLKQAVLNETDPAARYALLAPTMQELSRKQGATQPDGGNLN